jgi:hypothetical protein
VETVEGDMFTQYGCLKFHAKRDGGPKLSLAVKNNWSMGWTRSWFYCRVSCLWSSEGGKSVYALHSRMSTLDYIVEPEVECPEDDANNAPFIRAITTLGGRDAVEEFVACQMYPIATSFGFSGVIIDTMLASKVQMSLLLSPIETVSAENGRRVLVEVETEAKRILGSFRPKEYDALKMADLANGGRLNLVF